MNKLVLLTLVFGLVGCSSMSRSSSENKMDSTLWFQTAGERLALTYQAFNLAKLRLNQDLWSNEDPKKRAIVVDVDETLVDNSPYQARNILEDKAYPDQWREWISAARAKALPGAVSFLKYADRKGVEIFYITNRKQIGFEPTLKNLKDLGFPVKKENLMLRTKTSNKKARRDKVLKNHRIVLFMGDNLGDFSEIFGDLNVAEREAMVHKFKKDFGKRFIVLPNPMYGDWEAAVYDHDFSKSESEKNKMRRDHLIPMSL